MSLKSWNNTAAESTHYHSPYTMSKSYFLLFNFCSLWYLERYMYRVVIVGVVLGIITKNHDVPHSLPAILFPWGFVSGTLCEHTIYIHLYAHLIPTSQSLGCLTDTSCNFPHKPTVCNTGTGSIFRTVTCVKYFNFGRAAATTSPAP